MQSTCNNLPVAVSIGDPSGIGPDIILKAFHNKDTMPLPELFVVGDANFLNRRAQELGYDVPIVEHTLTEHITPDKLHVLDIGMSITGTPGKPNAEDAKATIISIDRSVALCFEGKASSLVTCPINKKVLYDVGFDHPGHTEYLAELGTQHTQEKYLPVMMLAGPQLRTVPVTIHIALNKINDYLTTELIVETATITARDLKQRFGLASPRLAISGLNPHAGEDGSMGHEDEEIIVPAVNILKQQGIEVVGPLPADTMFHESARARYDVAICMYHDQALIPAKTLGFDDAVNVTLGLPFIRTSPDHGTAYDIAGTGKANPASFIAALKMASEMSNNS